MKPNADYKDERVIIINDFDLTSSIGITFQDYEKAIKDYGKMYSLAYSWRYFNKKYPGEVVSPSLFSKYQMHKLGSAKIPDIGAVVGSRLPSFFYSKFVKDMKFCSKESIIHYSNNRIVPFAFNDRSVVTMNDLIFLQTRRFKEIAIKLHLIRTTNIYMKFRNVIAVSSTTKKDLINYGFNGNITVIYQPISAHFRNLDLKKATLRNKLKLPQDKILILSVSTNRPGKNLKALKEMMRLMDERYKLVRVGVPVGDSITFQHVSDETLNEIYNACDVMVFPSTEEGFGIPVTEAFKVGLPVVASDIEVMQEVCGNAAILTEPTPHKIAQSIGEALSNSDIFRSKGFNRSLLFGVERFKEDMIKFYRRI